LEGPRSSSRTPGNRVNDVINTILDFANANPDSEHFDVGVFVNNQRTEGLEALMIKDNIAAIGTVLLVMHMTPETYPFRSRVLGRSTAQWSSKARRS
jgi:hypothetical protein